MNLVNGMKVVLENIRGQSYDELFINLWTLMKIPTEELPTIVNKNCEEQAKSITKNSTSL